MVPFLGTRVLSYCWVPFSVHVFCRIGGTLSRHTCCWQASARHLGSRDPIGKPDGVEWSGYIGRIPCSSKSSKSPPQASQQAFWTSESAPAYLFDRDCFVDSFWGALWSEFGPFWNGYGYKKQFQLPWIFPCTFVRRPRGYTNP